MGKASIDEVWRRISAHQHERFEMFEGLPLTYVVEGPYLTTDRSDFRLSRTDFAKALELVPIESPGKINFTVRGPGYIWAILHDPRIRQEDW